MKKYSKISTVELAKKICLENCLIDINTLINKEGCSEILPFFNNSETVIDLDLVEGKLASLQSRSPFKSMDSTFVISSDSVQTVEAVLTEFRFNYLNLKNLKKQDLFGKVKGSTDAINGVEVIHQKYYFIFESSLKQQAIRRFRNMVPSMPNNFIATDISELKKMFFLK